MFCKICFGDLHDGITFLEYIKQEDVLCGHCRKKMIEVKIVKKLQSLSIEALYEYDETLENLLFNFKESRDVALEDVFLFPYIRYLKKKYRHYAFVYMPSAPVKTKERGFFPLECLFRQVSLPKYHLFYKDCAYKQSQQPFNKRRGIREVMKLTDANIPQMKLLLIDDVCTSGATLLHAYELLNKHPYEVRALVIGIHPKLLI